MILGAPIDFPITVIRGGGPAVDDPESFCLDLHINDAVIFFKWEMKVLGFH